MREIRYRSETSQDKKAFSRSDAARASLQKSAHRLLIGKIDLFGPAATAARKAVCQEWPP